MGSVTLLDYGAGNVRSVRNAIRALGFEVLDVASPADILAAERLVFPGVGVFGSAVGRLQADGYLERQRGRRFPEMEAGAPCSSCSRPYRL